MDQSFNILLIILILCVIALIAILSFIGFKFLKIREKEIELQKLNMKKVDVPSHDQVESPPRSETFRFSKSVSADLLKALRMRQDSGGHFCKDHPEEYSLGLCAISSEPYCEKCMSVQNEVKVAKKYLDIYLDNEWLEVSMLPNHTLSHDMIERLIKIKEDLWQNKNLPLMIQGHHKINVDTDEIEIYTVIFARSEDKDFIRSELSFIN